jgi:hypothetical protein
VTDSLSWRDLGAIVSDATPATVERLRNKRMQLTGSSVQGTLDNARAAKSPQLMRGSVTRPFVTSGQFKGI